MRLFKARVQKYRSIRDTGYFDIENSKTIFVGPNEAGKSAVLKALQQIKPPAGVKGFDALRDYPRSEYNQITRKQIDPSTITVAEAHFRLEAPDLAAAAQFADAVFIVGRKLNNESWYRIEGGPKAATLGDIKRDFLRMVAHVDDRPPAPGDFAKKFADITAGMDDAAAIEGAKGTALTKLLNDMLPRVDEANEAEEARHQRLLELCRIGDIRAAATKALAERIPVFVLFSNYFRVRPLIHLEQLAHRTEQGSYDEGEFDYGNLCLLKLLGFTPRELSNLGRAPDPGHANKDGVQAYRDQLDRRSYQLNAASVRLTGEICTIWAPDPKRGDADKLRITADGQYLKVVVEDSLGVEIELNQRSEGFQWLVSFFVVFFAEAEGKHKNAILLLDEPGLNLHGLKQREFRHTLSRLAEQNQTLYTTHSPFLVGSDELDIVRVVEMPDRQVGTKVHSQVISQDPAALLPLQEALGYDLAQSLFSQQRNLVIEGLTDYWYLDATAALLREAGIVDLNEKVALVPAQSAGKVVYFATILHAHDLKVAALLDSDAAGESAAQQDTLIHTLGNKNILRTKDFYKGPVERPEVEDLLRNTLVQVVAAEMGTDVKAASLQQQTRPLVDLLAELVPAFSKYKLAKAYLRWASKNTAKALTDEERAQWTSLFSAINRALK